MRVGEQGELPGPPAPSSDLLSGLLGGLFCDDIHRVVSVSEMRLGLLVIGCLSIAPREGRS